MNKNRVAAGLLTGAMVLGTMISGGQMAMLFSNAATVQAAEDVIETTGGMAVMGGGSATITIRGNEGQPLTGKNFHLYKLFLAEKSADGKSVNYSFNPPYEQVLREVVLQQMQTENGELTLEEIDEYVVIDYIMSLQTGTKEGSYSKFRYFIEGLRDKIIEKKISAETIHVNDVQDGNLVKITGLDFGYYIVDEVLPVEGSAGAGSLCMVDTANPSADISIKSDYPEIIKKIQEDDPNASIQDPNRWNDIADYEIGQKVPYRFTSNIPDMNGYAAYYYAWHDRMDDSLTFDQNSVGVTIKSGEKEYRLKPEELKTIVGKEPGETFQVEVTDIKAIVDREFGSVNEFGEKIYGQTVILDFNAALNDKAAKKTGRPGFENDVRLEFSNDADSDNVSSTGFTPWDTVVCFTYKMNVEKLDDTHATLEGAKFRLFSDEACENEVFVKKSGAEYVVINRDAAGGQDHVGGNAPKEAVEMVSPGEGSFVVSGLDSGTYYLKEMEAPKGYRLLKKPVIITVKPTFTQERDTYVKGSGTSADVLQKLDVIACVESFYDGILGKKEEALNTDVQMGSFNVTVINKAGSNLPVTGNAAMLMMTVSGTMMMIGVLVKRRSRDEK